MRKYKLKEIILEQENLIAHLQNELWCKDERLNLVKDAAVTNTQTEAAAAKMAAVLQEAQETQAKNYQMHRTAIGQMTDLLMSVDNEIAQYRRGD